MSFFGRKTEPKQEQAEAARAQAPPPTTPARFGIDEAIRLLKTLPVDQNPALVLFALKSTLASLKVDIDGVIADGGVKQERLLANITELRASIAELERQADVHRAEIAAIEVELAETTQAKERLERAKRGDESPLPAPPVPPPPPRTRSVKPPSFPKPPPRTPSTQPAASSSAKASTSADSADGPESDLLGMLPDPTRGDRS